MGLLERRRGPHIALPRAELMMEKSGCRSILCLELLWREAKCRGSECIFLEGGFVDCERIE